MKNKKASKIDGLFGPEETPQPEVKHTEGEIFSQETGSGQGMIYGPDGKTIAVFYQEGDAAKYAHKLNLFPELVEALEAFAGNSANEMPNYIDVPALLKKAKGE